MSNTRSGHSDPTISCVVTKRVPLYYEEGADVNVDRPRHVRSGSAVVWLNTRKRLAVIQDDASFIALVDPKTARATSEILPWQHEGQRQFDAMRGNKAMKLDLEACVCVSLNDELDRMIAFGSGSSPMREKIVVADVTATTFDVQIVDAHALYETFRQRVGFSGSELNIEGACIVGGTLRLFQRGNGMANEASMPVDATCDLDLERFLSFLEAPEALEPPELENVHVYDLGALQNTRYTFTDATMHNGTLYFLAAAEASPNATDDGPVVGTALGVATDDATFVTPITDEDGKPFLVKVEGLVANPFVEGEFFIVTDRDDPSEPAELCTLSVTMA